MAHKEQRDDSTKGKSDMASGSFATQSPEVRQSLEKLHKHYSEYAIPVQELRELMDIALGEQTLTGELYKMREG